jgi:CheY-like chemotaxis protein
MSTTPPLVLLVEDDPNAALLVQRSLSRREPALRLRHLSDADQAMAYLQGQPPFSDRLQDPLPALILLDLKLPGRSGLELLHWLRHEPRLGSLIVVVLSCSDDPRDVARAYDLGANSYVVKPIKLERFQHDMNCLLDYWLLNVLRPPDGPTADFSR